MSSEQKMDRYKHENESIIVEVGVKNSRQLFNERNPAPFRERDLDPQFVIYLVSAVEEFPLRAKMKIRILTSDSDDLRPENSLAIQVWYSSGEIPIHLVSICFPSAHKKRAFGDGKFESSCTKKIKEAVPANEKCGQAEIV